MKASLLQPTRVLFWRILNYNWIRKILSVRFRKETVICYRQITIFIRPYNVKEEDKNILDKTMKRLYYLGILKEGFHHTWVQLC